MATVETPQATSETTRATANTAREGLLAAVLALSGLITCLGLSWIILALANFSYGFWHDYAGIGEVVDRWGGSNRFKQGFETTTRDERVRLFAAINLAIHRSGEGLEAIEFTAPGLAPQQLLREPEVIHLQDVANLIDVGKGVALGGLVVLAGSLVLIRRRQWPMPRPVHQLWGLAAVAVMILIPVLVMGPTEFFYLLHVWIFPADHEWFFYYQDSLMSTLMAAPTLFGWIALEWVAVCLALFALLLWAEHRFWGRPKTA